MAALRAMAESSKPKTDAGVGVAGFVVVEPNVALIIRQNN